MTDWPNDDAIWACINWNVSARNQADRDAKNHFLAVPDNATKRIYREGRALNVKLTQDEYRSVRAADSLRHQRNIDALTARLEMKRAA